MKDKYLKQKLWQEKLADIAWKNFCESGEIGAYMFYKRIEEGEEVARLHTKRRGAESNRLERKRQARDFNYARKRIVDD